MFDDRNVTFFRLLFFNRLIGLGLYRSPVIYFFLPCISSLDFSTIMNMHTPKNGIYQ